MNDDLLILIIVLIIIVVIVVWIVRRRDSNAPQAAKSETLPVFLKPQSKQRFAVTAAKVTASVTLPKEFDARKQWPGTITSVFDQGQCGSCWAFSASSVFGDRLRIKGMGLSNNDHISQYHLAACMKCQSKGENGKVCKRVCNGHYMDEVIQWLSTNGAYSYHDVKSHISGNGLQIKHADDYVCFEPEGATIYKAKGGYRVNPYTMDQLHNDTKRKSNEKTIMNEIMNNGPVTATIRVHDPIRGDLSKNLYLHKTGVYGYPWTKDPAETDGYHAISIVGWGEEIIDGTTVPYWIIRNSWGTEWGENGFGKVLRGANRCIIESDVWAPDV